MKFNQLVLSLTRGFSSADVHEVTGDAHDVRGFDRHGVNLNGTRYDARGFDALGRHCTGGMYNQRGFNSIGFTRNGTAFDDEGHDDGLTMARFQNTECRNCEAHMCPCRRAALCDLNPQTECGIPGPDGLCLYEGPAAGGGGGGSKDGYYGAYGCRDKEDDRSEDDRRYEEDDRSEDDYHYEEDPYYAYCDARECYEQYDDHYEEEEDYHASFGCCGDHSGPAFCDCNANRDDY